MPDFRNKEIPIHEPGVANMWWMINSVDQLWQPGISGSNSISSSSSNFLLQKALFTFKTEWKKNSSSL